MFVLSEVPIRKSLRAVAYLLAYLQQLAVSDFFIVSMLSPKKFRDNQELYISCSLPLPLAAFCGRAPAHVGRIIIAIVRVS